MGWIEEKMSAATLRMAMRKRAKRSRLTMTTFYFGCKAIGDRSDLNRYTGSKSSSVQRPSQGA
jgi:hypothetical protein